MGHPCRPGNQLPAGKWQRIAINGDKSTAGQTNDVYVEVSGVFVDSRVLCESKVGNDEAISSQQDPKLNTDRSFPGKRLPFSFLHSPAPNSQRHCHTRRSAIGRVCHHCPESAPGRQRYSAETKSRAFVPPAAARSRPGCLGKPGQRGAPVLRPAFVGVVVGNWLGLAEPDSDETAGRQALTDEVGDNRLRPRHR